MEERTYRALEYRRKVRERNRIRKQEHFNRVIDTLCGLACGLAIFGLSAYCTWLWMTYQVV